MEIANIIKEIKNRNNWSDEEFSKRIEVEQDDINLFENGKKEPSQEIVHKIELIYLKQKNITKRNNLINFITLFITLFFLVLFFVPFIHCYITKTPVPVGELPETIWIWRSPFETLYLHWLLPEEIIYLLTSVVLIAICCINLKNKGNKKINYILFFLLMGLFVLLTLFNIMASIGFSNF